MSINIESSKVSNFFVLISVARSFFSKTKSCSEAVKQMESIIKFFKKNGVLLTQIAVLCLPIIIFLEYFTLSETADIQVEPVALEKVTAETVIQKTEKSDNSPKQQKEPVQSEAATFEVDEVSQEMLDNSSKNPQELLSASSPCKSFEDIKTLVTHTGTISKAKNIDHFPKPLPAMITETEYTCVSNKGDRQIKFTVTGVATDPNAKVLRCIQSNSDETLDREARFKHVLKTMTHHCGFKLSEHHAVQNQ
jgi:hypothetical protein